MAETAAEEPGHKPGDASAQVGSARRAARRWPDLGRLHLADVDLRGAVKDGKDSCTQILRLYQAADRPKAAKAALRKLEGGGP